MAVWRETMRMRSQRIVREEGGGGGELREVGGGGEGSFQEGKRLIFLKYSVISITYNRYYFFSLFSR